jgi:sarcosine oxidase subunit gamma
MAERYLRQSALAHLGLEILARDTPGKADVAMYERTFSRKANLRGSGKDFFDAFEAAFGLPLPKKALTSSVAEDLMALWLGPDEWLLVARGQERPLDHMAREALSGRAASVVDVSDGLSVIAVEGPRARDLLARGCSLDLHPRVFADGAVARSLLAKAPVILHRRDKDSFDLYVGRSFAEYLWQWLAVSASDLDLAILHRRA